MKKNKLSVILPYFLFFGKRIDQILSHFFQEYSRSFLKKCILNNQVLVNGKIENHPDKKMIGGEKIVVLLFNIEPMIDIPENIFLDIVYEDEDILVINKPAGLVVHPGAGNRNGTLLNALLYRYITIHNLPRAGIVHRLDKDTSGLMVIAKTIISYTYLFNLLKNRKIIRKYQAIVQGSMISGGIIDAPIMRHHIKRTCMMVNDLGKKSVTHYKIIKKFSLYTHISVQLETGRTHQIRVHMLHIGYPIVGDSVYNRNFHHPITNIKQKNQKIFFPRQALHAYHLSFCHPITKKKMKWIISLPKDMITLLKIL
ncbi:23S rRNA pseudouridine(1911/1915/1917) synthase RluD [Buchnera aphidicola]|uniref:23S rRNA pseudouridine(1911/1915/1917) synthase RluD n=1 Tax=Buchnera aphidicola TaxID=9 RepID=UPI003BEF245A